MRRKTKQLLAIALAVLMLGLSVGCQSTTESGETTATQSTKTSTQGTSTGDDNATGGSDANTTQSVTSSDSGSEATTAATSGDTEVWSTTAVAEPVSGSLTDEEILAGEKTILQKGTVLTSELAVNTGYYPSDISWLKSAEAEGSLAIIYACDDTSHGGWGVLGLAVKSGLLSSQKQEDIMAYGENPDQERLKLYTMSELCTLAEASSPSDITSLAIGAWNGGRIAMVAYLDASLTTELQNYIAQASAANAIVHTYDGSLSNENAIASAQSVYAYLKSEWGVHCLTGQMESTWMGSADYEMDYIYENTGKYPAIRGLDFMNNDFSGVVSRAKEWWDKGGIVTICWHTGPDFASGYTESQQENIDWDEAFTPGSDTYNALIAGMDRAVPYLQELEDAGVPVLWRPFHELDGGWFWWSYGGSENFVKLWQLMYSRYTDYWGLDNLIWVFGYSHNGMELEKWYPGDDYVDLIGADSYDAGANADLYEAVSEVAASGMPIVFHECGTIPTEDEMKSGSASWLYFMTWHTDYITDSQYNTKKSLSQIYNSDYFITLDELPKF